MSRKEICRILTSCSVHYIEVILLQSEQPGLISCRGFRKWVTKYNFECIVICVQSEGGGGHKDIGGSVRFPTPSQGPPSQPVNIFARLVLKHGWHRDQGAHLQWKRPCQKILDSALRIFTYSNLMLIHGFPNATNIPQGLCYVPHALNQI